MTITAIASLSKEIEEKQSVAQNSLTQVISAIKSASKQTGVDFAYLVNKAAQESSFKTDAKAKTSSATGLYQFTEQTWLQMVKDNGSKYGLEGLADKIIKRTDGSLTVKDRALRHQILEMRKNPQLSAAMAAELAQDNKTYLQNNVGGTIGNTELYLAHFLGAAGAANFLTAMRSNPQTKADNLLPDAAAANHSVFYNADGTAKSVGAIYDRFAAKMEGKGVDIPDSVANQPTMLAMVGQALNAVPDLRLRTANITSLASASAPAASVGGHSLAEGATASALFSAMVLSQVDAFKVNADKSLPGDKAVDKGWVQTVV